MYIYIYSLDIFVHSQTVLPRLDSTVLNSELPIFRKKSPLRSVALETCRRLPATSGPWPTVLRVTKGQQNPQESETTENLSHGNARFSSCCFNLNFQESITALPKSTQSTTQHPDLLICIMLCWWSLWPVKVQIRIAVVVRLRAGADATEARPGHSQDHWIGAVAAPRMPWVPTRSWLVIPSWCFMMYTFK